MRTRMSPNCRVRHVASPVAPLCVVGATAAQSVMPNGMALMCMAQNPCVRAAQVAPTSCRTGLEGYLIVRNRLIEPDEHRPCRRLHDRSFGATAGERANGGHRLPSAADHELYLIVSFALHECDAHKTGQRT